MTTPPAPLLAIRNLSLAFLGDDNPQGRDQVLTDVCLDILPAATHALVGESGSGKSVTALSVLRLLEDVSRVRTSGQILFKDQDLLAMDRKKMLSIRGNQIAMIFQEPMTSLNPIHSCGRQVMESILIHHGGTKNEARRKAIEILGHVRIPNPERVFGEFPHQLSGGMRQRVMIAMALACRPKLLIADEPTTALDVTIQAQILELMKALRSDIDSAIIMITHDLGVVAEICDRVLVMYAGRIVESASIKELFRSPLHPYTEGLLRSIPRISEKRGRLSAIEGIVPGPFETPQGCAFAPRCGYAKDICIARTPDLVDFPGGRSVRCWLRQPEGGAGNE